MEYFTSFQVNVFTMKSSMWIFLVIGIWTGCYSTSLTGHRLIGSQAMMAKVGDTVILPCYITPPVSAVKMTVEWIRPDLDQFVRLLQQGVDNPKRLQPSYRYRTSGLTEEELSRGNISLNLFGVQLSDQGTFKCSAPHLADGSCYIQLNVGAVFQPVISFNGQKDGGMSLTCDSGCWFPEPVVSWLFPNQSSVEELEPPNSRLERDDCYIVQKTVTVRRAGYVTCRVQLPHINHTKEIHSFIAEKAITVGGTADHVCIAVLVILVVILVAIIVVPLCWKKWKKTELCRRCMPTEANGDVVVPPGDQSGPYPMLTGTPSEGVGGLDEVEVLSVHLLLDRQNDTPEWCTCGRCQTMPTEKENKCCRMILELSTKLEQLQDPPGCFSLHPGFESVCLNPFALENAFKVYKAFKGPLDDGTGGWQGGKERCWWLAYRSFNSWIYGYLSTGHPEVIPSCVTCRVKDAYSDDDGAYGGFRPNFEEFEAAVE